MDARTTYDVILAGTGAGGGTLLRALAPTGKRILVLERGGRLPREKDNWSSRAVFAVNKYKADETWFDAGDRGFNPEIHYYVGGNTKLYGAALLRFRERDFEEVRHFDGVSPAWPIRYDELEPYYTEAERLYHVHGERGIDPLEPQSSAPFPCAALRHEPRIQEIHDALERLGHAPFPLPVGVMLDEANPDASRCIRCDTCDGFPCLVHAKADAETCGVEPALRYPNVTLLTHARVERLETGPSGREVTRVIAEVDGRTEEFTSDVVVLSCGAVNSAAVLLRSVSDAHPRGLANGSDMVGRHYMCHNNSAFVALSTVPNPTVFQKTLALNSYYFESAENELPLGHIQTMGKADTEKFGVAAPMWVPRPILSQLANHSVDFWLTSEDLPRSENRVTLRDDGSIRLVYRETNLEAHDRLNAKLKALLSRIGKGRSPFTLSLRKKIPISGTTHQCGTLRFGHDATTSVLDPSCKAHDVDNLYVVDGSFFASSAAMNPALTIIANALRVADRMKARFGWRDTPAG